MFVNYKWRASDGADIKLMGLDFKFDEKDFVIDSLIGSTIALTLLCIGQSILRYIHSINDKGFVCDDALSTCLLLRFWRSSLIMDTHLIKLGNSEITYTL